MSSPANFSSPYNVTIGNESPLINYIPYRDGPLERGWNLTCSQSDDSTWVSSSLCAGTSSHQTSFIGASMEIDFVGTAFYLHGNAEQGSYTITLDGGTDSAYIADLSSNILAMHEGLPYGKHSVVVNVTGGSLLSFLNAILTVGVGRGDSANSIQTTKISPFSNQSTDSNVILNPLITYSGSGWESRGPNSAPIGPINYPRRDTNVANDHMAFTITQASAFLIYGSVNFDHGQYQVTFVPPGNEGPSEMTTYNGSAHWITVDTPIFWATGLDSGQSYNVQLTNLGQGSAPYVDFSYITVLEATPTGPLVTNNPVSTSKHHSLPIADIVGGTVGFVVLVLLFGTLLWFIKKKPKQKTADNAPQLPFSIDGVEHPNYEASPLFTQSSNNISYVSSQPQQYGPAAPGLPLNPIYQSSAYSSYTEPQSNWNPDTARISHYTDGESNPSNSGIQNRSNSQIIREEDAGTLHTSPYSGIVRLPPDYKEAWAQDAYGAGSHHQ